MKKRKFNNERGAMDLASIMVGVVVLGIISGLIAATVFVVIPWAQDESAKQQLSNVKTAQEGYIGMQAGGLLNSYATVALKAADEAEDKSSYGSMKDLVQDGLLGVTVDSAKDGFTADGNMCTNATLDGYEAAIKSVTGSVFKTANGEKITKSAPGETTCLGVTGGGPGEVVDPEGPSLPEDEPTMAFSYNCPVSTVPVVPVDSFTGTATWNVNGTETVINAASISDVNGIGNVPANTPVTLRMEGTFGPNVSMTTGFTTDQKNCLRSVDTWTTETISAAGAFNYARNLTSIASPPESITDATGMFEYAMTFNGSIGTWTASNVTNMNRMFSNAFLFNQPVNFDTANVNNMSAMFANAQAFNQPVNFDTANVNNMGTMFSGAYVFNQPVNFDTANVNNMNSMFANAAQFDQPVNFTTNGVTGTGLASMFSGAAAFNQSVGTFNTANVTSLASMFRNSSFNQPVNNFNTTRVTDMSSMFMNTPFNHSVSSFNTVAVRNMSNMFYNNQGTSQFNQSLNTFNTYRVTNMSGMFTGAQVFNQPFGGSFTTLNVTNMSGMFTGAHTFNQPLGNADYFDTANVKNMSSMFSDTPAFNQDISNWDVTAVTSWSNFKPNSALTDANTPAKFR